MSFTALQIKQRIASREQMSAQSGSINSSSIIGSDIRIALGEILDCLISGGTGISTASNGLILSGTDVQLGGALVKNTSIDGVFSLTMGGITPLTQFVVINSVATELITTSGTQQQVVAMAGGNCQFATADSSTGIANWIILGSSNGILQYHNSTGSISSTFQTDVNGAGISTVYGSSLLAYLKSDLLTSTSKTFQFPNVSGTLLAISSGSTPSSSSAAGSKGEIRTDGTYMYLCINTNTWLRALMATW